MLGPEAVFISKEAYKPIKTDNNPPIMDNRMSGLQKMNTANRRSQNTRKIGVWEELKRVDPGSRRTIYF